MTLSEFKSEFIFKYDAASSGAPDLNDYEISLCLTQANKDIIEEAYNLFETSERSKRILAPLLRTQEATVTQITTDSYLSLLKYQIEFEENLPELHYVLREEAKLKNCTEPVTIINDDLDYVNISLKNPFKRPNRRKIVKIESGYNRFIIYSTIELLKYRITYLKTAGPIILSDFTLNQDTEDETISNLSVPTATELPEFIHDEIVDRAVILAIKALRQNNLQTQTQIK